MIDLNPIPNRLTRPDTIDDDADLFFPKLPGWAAELQALYAGMLSTAAGGSFGVPFVADTSTANTDPGAGRLRFNNAAQSSSTALYIDNQNSAGLDVTPLLLWMGQSTSGVKGKMRLVKANDPLKWLTFDVLSVTQMVGYVNVQTTNGSGSAASPFTASDALVLQFDRTGDKGDQGSTNASYQLLGAYSVSSAIANIDFFSIVNSTYEKFIIEANGLLSSVAANLLAIQLVTGGTTVQNTTAYSRVYAGGQTNVQAEGTNIPLRQSTSTGNYNTVATGPITIEVAGANSTNPSKRVSVRGMFTNAATNTNEMVSGEAFAGIGPVITGFRLLWNSGGNFTAGTVRVYGVKNS